MLLYFFSYFIGENYSMLNKELLIYRESHLALSRNLASY